MKTIHYVFHCPVHGHRGNAFCFRALSGKYRDCWQKRVVEYEQIEFNEGELDSFLAQLATGTFGAGVRERLPLVPDYARRETHDNL